MKKYPHGLTLNAICAAIEDYQRHEDNVPEEGILAAFNTLLGHSDIAEEFRAMEKQRDALAAENATIKTMNDVLSEELRGYESDGAYDGPIAHKLWHSNSETPATDAYLNTVRAEGGPSLQSADLKALMRFNVTSDDGQGYDIGDDAMNRLVELGLVAKERGKMRIITSFGMWVIARENGEQAGVLETQRDRDLAFQQRLAQLRAGKDGE